VNTIDDKTRQFCLDLTQFPICNCLVSNILRITENLETGNFVETTRQNSSKLGQDITELSCLVCGCVHITDADKTRQSCLVCVGGVIKLLTSAVSSDCEDEIIGHVQSLMLSVCSLPTLCLKKTALLLHTITSMHINRFK